MSESPEHDSEILEEAAGFVEETREALSHSPNVSEDVRGQIERRLNELRHRIEDGDDEAVEELLDKTRSFIDSH
ncbi:MAG: hypothetical protein ABEK29_07040, partial [Bradymonadaceae bacterium]